MAVKLSPNGLLEVVNAEGRTVFMVDATCLGAVLRWNPETTAVYLQGTPNPILVPMDDQGHEAMCQALRDGEGLSSSKDEAENPRSIGFVGYTVEG